MLRKLLCLPIFIFFILPTIAYSASVSLNLAPLEFSNRAACAALSTSPARSVFLFIDGFTAGKAAYSSGITKSLFVPSIDPNQYAIKGTKLFRLWSTYFTVKTLEKITTGKLPLFPTNISAAWPAYSKANAACLNKNQLLTCPTMNDLLSDIWARAQQSNPKWEDFYLTSSNFYPKTNAPILGCHVVKKFSAFHSNLATTRIENGIINNLAFAALNPETTLDSCYSYGNDDADPRFATIQLDIANLKNDTIWDKYGFDVWHTLKLYLAWGWRHDPEMQQKFAEFSPDFRSLALEDSLMLVPNGCRSVDLPRCDEGGLASDAIRAAKMLGASHIAVGELPQKPIDMLFTRTSRPINNDELGLLKAENADAWHRDFKDKLLGIRSQMLSKFNIATTKLQILSELLPSVALEQDLLKLTNSNSMLDINEAYLACTEYTLAQNNLFEDIHKEINNLNNTKELDTLMLSGNDSLLKKSVDIYNKSQLIMNRICKVFENRKLWKNQTVETKYGLHEWAFKLLYPKDLPQYNNSYCHDNSELPGGANAAAGDSNSIKAGCPNTAGQHYLTYQNEIGSSAKLDLCHTALECTRIILDSVVNIVSIRRYAQAFLPLKDIIASPNLFNTYDMPKACGLYDPFYYKRRAWKLFLADLGSAAIMGATCGGLNFKVIEPSHNKVTSFSTIHDDYMTKYEPEYKKDGIKWSLSANLGFLGGIPCGFSYANTTVPLTNLTNSVYGGAFAGVRVGACKSSRVVDVKVEDVPITSTIYPSSTTDKQYRVCFQCNVNLLTITSSAASASCLSGNLAAPALNFGIGLFQGLVRLYSNLTDANNIPHSSEVDVDLIAQIASEYEPIPKRCMYKLKRGYQCLVN